MWLKDSTSKKQLTEAVAEHRVLQLLNEVTVKLGDFLLFCHRPRYWKRISDRCNSAKMQYNIPLTIEIGRTNRKRTDQLYTHIKR